MSTHTITLAQENLIGSFTDEVTPILKIKSGDSIRFQTLDAGWGTGVSFTKRIKPFHDKVKRWRSRLDRPNLY